MIRISTALAALVIATSPVFASVAAAQPAAKAPRTAKGVGVVTEIDAKQGVVTLKHEPIAALGWPSMTMPFRASPQSLLAKLKVGQKIEFDTSEGNGVPLITAIRKPHR